MARKVRKREAEAPFQTRVVSIGRWYRKLYGRTEGELDERQAEFLREWNERRARWRTDYGIELPTNVDQWERLLSRVGLSPEDVSDVLAGIPDIDLIINHVEGYLDRVRVDSGRTDPRPSPKERLTEPLGAHAGDHGDTKPPALPAGAEAIDEYDVALLAFLNRNPSLRRKVSDVLPEKGPQDRKAVAKRLRRLANRTPPLVDYPKDGRSGVAILPAGVEALKRATAPTPR